MKVTATVDRLRREGVEVIDFGAGEPDFSTPRGDQRRGARGDRPRLHQVHAGRRDRGAEAGDLRALPARLRRRLPGERGHHQRRRQAGAVQHGAGAVQRRRRGHHARAVLADAVRAGQARRGDAGARAHASPEDGFAITAGPILDAITPRTRGIIINSPCNPTGALISEADLARDRPGSGAARHLGDHRPLLREADLRRDAAQPAGGARTGTAAIWR